MGAPERVPCPSQRLLANELLPRGWGRERWARALGLGTSQGPSGHPRPQGRGTHPSGLPPRSGPGRGQPWRRKPVQLLERKLATREAKEGGAGGGVFAAEACVNF